MPPAWTFTLGRAYEHTMCSILAMSSLTHASTHTRAHRRANDEHRPANISAPQLSVWPSCALFVSVTNDVRSRLIRSAAPHHKTKNPPGIYIGRMQVTTVFTREHTCVGFVYVWCLFVYRCVNTHWLWLCCIAWMMPMISHARPDTGLDERPFRERSEQ